MNNKRATKRALLTSIMALVMCVVMLVGTTFAWFTDTASTGVNKIQAGNLDITVEYAKEKMNDDGTLAGVLTDWKPIDNATNVFDPNALWEPGRTEYVVFRITNNGNLALKYKLSLETLAQKPGTNKANEQFYLADYLCASAKVDVGPGEIGSGVSTLGAFMTKLNDLGVAGVQNVLDPEYHPLTDATVNGTLLPGKTNCVPMAIWMPTSVGNEANAIDDSEQHAATIDFGITVVATQYTHEFDSFGNEYDEDAEYPISVTTGDELQAIVSNATAPVNIVLTNSITTNNFVIPADKDVTLDLNGRTVTNAGSHTILNKGHLTLTDSSADKSGQIISLKSNTAALRNGDNAVCVVEGGTISRDGADGNTWHVVENFGKMTFNGGKVVLKNGNGFAITNGWNYFDPGASTTHAVMEINALELDTDSSGIKNCRYGDLTVNDVTVTSTGYWALSNDYLGTAVINGGTLTSSSFKAVSNGAAMTVNGGTFNGTQGFFVQTYATSTVLNGGTFANMTVDALSSYVGTGHTAQQSGTSVIIK